MTTDVLAGNNRHVADDTRIANVDALRSVDKFASFPVQQFLVLEQFVKLAVEQRQVLAHVFIFWVLVITQVAACSDGHGFHHRSQLFKEMS